MSRRCTCKAIHDALRDDPRLRTLPLAARHLWLLLAQAVETGFGVLPFSGFARVSLLVSASVTEVETHLPTLLAEGLVLEDGGTLVVPLVRDLAEARAVRTRAAQENGQKGGRPRRGETPEAARLRRAQPHLPLPIEGGRAERPETQETQIESSRASDLTSSIPIEKQSDQSALTGAKLRAWCEQCAEAAGLDPNGTWTWGEPKMWREQGHSEATILATLREVTARAVAQGTKPGSFRYFVKAMAEAKPAAPVPTLDAMRASAAWDEAMRVWQGNGGRGPMPQRPGSVAA